MVRDLREARANQSDFPEVLMVYIGSLEDGETFFRQHWPEGRAIADQGSQIFHSVGLRKGRPGELFGPKVMVAAVKALFRGFGIGKPTGNPLMMPGVFLCEDGTIIRDNPMKHVGDHPDFIEFTQV